MARYYGDEVGNSLPSDLEKTAAASAASAGSTSKDSYTKKINIIHANNCHLIKTKNPAIY